jgi:general secretion pathway protein E
VKNGRQLGFGEHEAQRLAGTDHGRTASSWSPARPAAARRPRCTATLKKLATDDVNVCTIEDPIEMIEPAFNQTQVQRHLDMGFAEGLRALMRQDPDIIMVGEIRDLATAEMAIQAALTGHLVFSTLHTNDSGRHHAAGRPGRAQLPDRGHRDRRAGAALTRTLCPACKVRDDSTTRDALDEVAKPWRLSGGVRPYKPVGCLECRHTGYRGRAGLYELLVMSDAARAAVHPAAGRPGALRRQAVKDGMRPLRLAGAMKVAEGVTTIEEVLRNTPSLDA